MTTIQARGIVPAPPDAVFAFLADFDNHWRLADDFELLSVDGALGGRVRLRGPLGISRVADTRVTEVRAPAALAGTARLGRRTQATVSWVLSDLDGTATCLELAADVVDASTFDRLLLAAGGRRWLERRFERIVRSLGSRFESGLVPVDRPGHDHVAA
jgi:Polyketide cyclase / dehydrase and lipid transport